MKEEYTSNKAINMTRKTYHTQKKKKHRAQLRNGAYGVVLATAIFTSTNAVSAASLSSYTVQQKDTLYKLSKQYGVSVEYLQQINHKKDHKLTAGEVIFVPDSKQKYEERTVKAGDTWYKFSEETNISVKELLQLNKRSSDYLQINETIILPVTAAENQKEIVQEVRVVKQNESLWKIAREYRMTVEDIKASNKLKNNKITVGQQLVIDGITQATVTITGAVDHRFVEFAVSKNESIVLNVSPFYNVEQFSNRQGLEILLKYNAKNNELISYEVLD